MRDLQIRPFDEGWACAWDDFVARSATNGTFLHTRRFLSYHRGRFVDASLVVLHGERLVGVLPAARQPSDESVVTSHPGLTYAGLVRSRELAGESLVATFEQLRAHYRREGYRCLRYKAVPTVFQDVPSADDSYAFFRMGSGRVRCDLSSAIDLSSPDRRNSNRRRGHQRALRAGVAVCGDVGRLTEYWDVLEARLADRHGVRPTHDLEEMRRLLELFPSAIQLLTGVIDGQVVGGLVLFRAGPAVHIQYSASTELGRRVSALDAITWQAVTDAANSGARWFSFGISTEDEGRELNESLYSFKNSFGAGGVVHEQFEIALG